MSSPGLSPTPAPSGDASPDGAAEASKPRFHHLDRLRAFLMLGGIPLHAAHTLRGQTPWINTPLLFMEIWRMATFFIIAGLFALMVIDRRGRGPWFADRTIRLGVPLAFAFFVINPMQFVLINHFEHRGGGHALFNLGDPLHAWFLVFLLAYCWLLFVALTAAPRATDKVLRAVGAVTLRNPWTLLVTSLALGALGMYAAEAWNDLRLSDGLAPFRWKFPVFALFFTFGLVVWRTPDGVRRLGELAKWPVIVAALVLLPLATWPPYAAQMPYPPGFERPDMILLFRYMSSLMWAAVLFRFFARFDSPAGPVVRWLVDASLPVYLVHHIFKFVFRPWLPTLTEYPVLNWFAVIAAMLVASFAIYEIANQFKWSRFCLTGSYRKGQDLTTTVKELRAGTRGAA